MNATLPIYSLSGTVIATAIVTESAISHEELMTADYVQLSWDSGTGDILPAGTYITIDGERYSLLDPYTPTLVNEAEYKYTPQFQSRIMAWQKHIVPLYTYATDGVTVKTREMDWNFTGSPADAMYMIQQAIRNETGEQWTVQLADSLPATITISSQSGSIFSVLNDIAGQCETEWWGDKATNTLFLSQCKHGTPVALTVGVNVGVPSVTASNDGYYTRFHVFGSTRNVTQPSGAAVTNSVINKRLTLDPATYPGGYIDARPNLQQGEIFTKNLYYDDIYPRSFLAISDVRARLKYRLDNNTGNRIQTGTDDEGNPIHEQYAIWYFKIAGFDFDPETIIPQKNLSVHFEDGQLAGRDFELTYHAKEDDKAYTDDALPFVVEAGDYEIMLDESEGITIPGLAYIIPQDGDQVILYNIEMPAEYTVSARQELAETAQKDIARMSSDNNSYEMDSNPVRFNADGTDLTLGRAVTYTNGNAVLSTRVLMVEKHLDYPCQQRIKVGNRLIKGNTQQLREQVAQATQNIDILATFNELSASLSNAYAKAQREMIEGFTRIGNMWRFDPEDDNTIYTPYNVYVEGWLSAKGKNPDAGGAASGVTELSKLSDVLLADLTSGQVLQWDGSKWMNVDIEQGLDETALAAYLATHGYVTGTALGDALEGYATQSWVTDQKYLKSVSLATISDLHSSWDAVLKAQKPSWLTTVSLSTISDLHASWDVLLKAAPSAYVTRWPAFSEVTGKPTTLSGYGITDGVNSVSVTGSGNAVTAASVSGYVLTLTKGTTFLVKSTFDDLFEKVALDGGGYAIRAKYALYSESWISAKGKNPDAGGTAAGGPDTLEELDDVQIGTKVNGQVLSWNATSKKWVNAAVPAGLDEAALASYLVENGYVTTSALTELATKTEVDERIDDLVNGAPAAYDTLKEIADVLQGNVDSIGDILTALGGKADKATTLAGYGITDAYTKTAADGRYALKSVSISAGTGLTGGGNLSANRTLSLAAVGTAGTYTKVTVDAYGRVTGHSSLAAGDIPNLPWSKITSGKPTTLGGYGITDGVNAVSVTGSGNAVTAASVSGHKLTLTKGSSFLLSSSYTAADILAKLKTVDGSGSGLDADLLDGIQSSGFRRRYSLGSTADSKENYIILSRAYNGTTLEGSYFSGTVFFNRGGAGAWNGKTTVFVNCGGQYQSNVTSYFVLGSSVNIQGIYRVIYDGVAYLALRLASTSSQQVFVEAETTLVPFITVGTNITSPTAISTGSVRTGGTLSVPSTIQLGSGTITWDATNNAFHFSHGVYSDSWISAKGANSSAGGTVRAARCPRWRRS